MPEGDIIDPEEVDKDTLESEALEQQFTKKYKLLTETAVSVKKTYVNKLHGTKSLKVVVGLADNSIEVYDLNKTSLHRICWLSGHSNSLTEVVFSPKDDNLIYSSGQDGVIKLWDTRSGGTCAMEYKEESGQARKQFECMDVSCNGRVMCAGSQLAQDDAFLVFWDCRAPSPLGGYWNSHTDDITQVKFHKTKTEIVASGSLDGLLNVYNILEESEDDALTYSLNVENSVEKITWLDERRAATLTQSNDAQLWDTASGDLLTSFTRDKVARSIKRSKGDDCYLVDMFPAADGSPVLLAGSYGGNGSVLRSVCAGGGRLAPRTNFSANQQTVRCCWHHGDQDVLVTAGERGLVSVWSPAEAPEAAGALPDRLCGLHVHRHKPY